MAMNMNRRNISKIVKYKLEQDVVNLRQAGLSYQKIADELNASGKIPKGDSIDKDVVRRFINNVPEINKELIKRNKKRMEAVVDNNIDIISEMSSLYNKTKLLLENMEIDAFQKNKVIDPYRFKAISSEMREMLKQMMDIQKELQDYTNTRKFMEIVMQTIKEISPEAIPLIVNRLKAAKETRWFGEIFDRN